MENINEKPELMEDELNLDDLDQVVGGRNLKIEEVREEYEEYIRNLVAGNMKDTEEDFEKETDGPKLR